MGLIDLFQTALSIEEGLEKMKEVQQAVLLDVRSEEEYKEGHVKGSINIPLNRLAAIDLQKETPVFVYCRSGARSKRATAFLQKLGYDAVNIGGIMNYKGKLVQ